MTDDTPPSLPPRVRQHITGHGDPSALQQQQDMHMWQHISLSQPQTAPGIQALPIGMGFNSRPQQQVWQDHTSAFSQRGWQPFPHAHTQQSPQEPQDLTRSQPQSWAGGDMNRTPTVQQLQQLVFLQQQQTLQMQQQQHQQHHLTHEQGLHHLDPLVQHDDRQHDKFTKSPSPQIEENRNSPAVGRPFMHNMTSPQQPAWQPVLHQYDLPHAEPQHSQAFSSVSHHQPLFAQQQYVHQPVWQHTPYSQLPVQHIRQNTQPMQQQPLQQQFLWQQQQQSQLQQHQLQQPQRQPLAHPALSQPDPQPPYSPQSSSSSSFTDRPTSFEKKDPDSQANHASMFNRMPTNDHISILSRKDRLNPADSSTGLSPLNSHVSMNSNSPKPPIRILSKSHQNGEQLPGFNHSPKQVEQNSPSISIAQNIVQRPVHGVGSGLNNTQMSMQSALKPQNFNPNPNTSPYQSMTSPSPMPKGVGVHGNQQSHPRFQSPGKEQPSGPRPNQYRPRSPAAVVRSHQPQGVVINNIYQRTGPVSNTGSNFHRMENMVVYAFVQGLDPRTQAESIRNYFEIVGKPTAVQDNILFSLDHTEALVVFTQKPEMGRLKQNVRNRKLDGKTLEVCEMPAPTAIVVSSDHQIRSTETLKHYFERDVVGGPLKKNRVEETEDGCLLLEFQSEKSVQHICSHQGGHKVDGVVLRVSPYYQCAAGAIWDTNLHVVPIPKPVNIQILPDQLEFVKAYSQPQFASRLRDKHADISFSKDHVTVTCVLHQKMPKYRQLVRCWETGIQEAVATFLAENIDQTDIRVPENVWDKMCDFLNSGRQELKDMLIKPNRDRKSLKLVGFKKKDNVRSAQKIIEEQIESLSRAMRRKTEMRKVKTEEYMKVLHYQGTFAAICKKFADLDINVKGNEVTVDGDPDDIQKAFIEMYSECDKIEPTTFKHSRSREWVQFLKHDSVKESINKKLEQQKLNGTWTVNGKEIIVFVPEGVKADAIKDTVYVTVLETDVPVDPASKELLQSEVWSVFQADLLSRQQEKVDFFTKNDHEVTVVGLEDAVPSVVKQIEDFLNSKAEKTVTVPCESAKMDFIYRCWTAEDFKEFEDIGAVLQKTVHGIKLTGLADNLISAKQKFDEKLKTITCKKHTLKKLGVCSVLRTAKLSGTITTLEKSHRCVIKLPQELENTDTFLRSTYEIVEPEIICGDETAGTHGSKVFQTRKLKIKIHLIQAEVSNIKTDILVFCTSPKLNLKGGPATQALLKAGGQQLQTDCDRLYPKGIKEGELAIIGGGQLKCEQIYLTTLPTWKEASSNGCKVLRDFMLECLRKADRHSKKSIVFTSMGTGGYLGYPRETVASLMYGTVVEFDSSYTATSLQEVNILLYSKDTDTVKAFEEHERMRLYGSASQGPLSTDFLNGGMKIELVVEDLSTQKVDSLLCTVSSDMNLTRSEICKSLLQNGGPSLQNDCKQKYNNELQVGKIADISGGKLPCKTVFLTVLPRYEEMSTAEKDLIDTLQRVLKLANSKNLRSIAIPALGTGYLNYPKNITAKCMYDTVLDWAANNPKASLRHVRFVMYSKDTEAQQAYRMCHLKAQGREARLNRNFQNDGAAASPSDDGAKYKMVKDGCVLGPVQLSVCIGDILSTKTDAIVNSVGPNFDMNGAVAQALVKKCPNILTECQQKKGDLQKAGVVITKSDGLAAPQVIHVVYQDSLSGWRAKMLTCLEQAEKCHLSSVAFPLLGSGGGRKSLAADTVAECLFTAIDDFIGHHNSPSVKEVRLLVHSSKISSQPDILSALQAKTSAAITNMSSTGRKLLAGLLEKLKGVGSKPKVNTKDIKSQAQRVPETVQVSVHSDAASNIDQCIQALEDTIGLGYTKKVIELDKDVFSEMSDSEMEEIIDPSILVDAKFDKKAGIVTLNGPSNQVSIASDCIHNKMRKFQHQVSTKELASLLYTRIRWCWLSEDKVSGGVAEKPYSEPENYVIETAYKEGRDEVELRAEHDQVYVIDFERLHEYKKTNKADSVAVVRKDILKVGQVPLPNNWETMATSENVKNVCLQRNKEFSDIEKEFVTQVSKGPYSHKYRAQNLQVVKIERIQNKTLYQQYMAKKKQMESKKKSGNQLERTVWHGTALESITSIVSNGFNRSYCGKHGTYFGKGVYFAGDASYSAQAYLAGQNSHRHMFLVKALTGEYIKGNRDMRHLPAKDPAKPEELYDCAVDDVTKPMEFVIFSDTQAYPEYLVTYTL
ncbi:protein mono-ADP-ribosyltransferase PARP14-like isoform X2 [Dreissena polymorpha]|uniref:protein mono-ADP-ribosyltransferase PARP14-like isoform X2 n=1 Tax=Dreissena polymorpha TaxID=45954 RepID=UPI002263E6FF|nr:protein mono-ADP-ribosyltransferase PARP14-like isoform X2 [Dreissena polymorpha]